MTTKDVDAAGKVEVRPEVTIPAQLRMMTGAFMASPVRNRILLLGGGLALVIGATALAQIRLNAWNRPFYDALTARDFGEFVRQLGVFAVLAVILLCLNVAQTWLNLTTKLKLREGLTHDLIHEWLQPGRAFRLSSAGEIGVNPDQRLHEDARNLTELSADLAIGLFQATLLLLSFIGVLWGLSRQFTFHVNGVSFEVPGYMVWWALFWAAMASWLSWFVGRPLIRVNADRYAREADFRFALVRTSEHVDSIALYGGEGDEERRLRADFGSVLDVMWRIVWATTRLRWVTGGYGWFTLVAPILAAAPAYFQGSLSFGELMMAVGAFNQVQNSLRWFVDNFGVIADWRATLVRIASFRQAAQGMDRLDQAATRIELAEAPDKCLAMTNLEVATAGGAVMLKEREAVIKPGERVAIVGEPGVGKTMLFRALAGLWPWGSGKIGLPPRAGMAFLPRLPYVPPGSLRAALSYPNPPETFQDADYAASLERVGLKRLASELERSARWDRELAEDDQRAVALARLVLHRPKWVIVDDAFGAFDPDRRQVAIDILRNDLKEAAIVNIGSVPEADDLFPRRLHLVKDPDGCSFVPAHHAPSPPVSAKKLVQVAA